MNRCVRDYEILESLGKGGMGEVFKARNTLIEEDFVAIKIIRPELAGEPELRKRFLQEAKALLKLNHPNIMKFRHIFEDEGQLFLVTEYIEGQPLSEVLHEKRDVSLEEGWNWFQQIGSGVAYAHKIGVVHRDLKPANIILQDDGIIRVLDFGLAKQLGTISGGGTAAGQVMGTPPYLPPEVITGEVSIKNAGEVADIYALGVIAYRMFSGRMPYNLDENESSLRLLSQLIKLHLAKEKIPPLESIRPDLPTPFVRVLMSGLERDPFQRPANTAKWLKRIRKTLPITSVEEVSKVVGVGETSKRGETLFEIKPAPPPPAVPAVVRVEKEKNAADGSGVSKSPKSHLPDTLVGAQARVSKDSVSEEKTKKVLIADELRVAAPATLPNAGKQVPPESGPLPLPASDKTRKVFVEPSLMAEGVTNSKLDKTGESEQISSYLKAEQYADGVDKTPSVPKKRMAMVLGGIGIVTAVVVAALLVMTGGRHGSSGNEPESRPPLPVVARPEKEQKTFETVAKPPPNVRQMNLPEIELGESPGDSAREEKARPESAGVPSKKAATTKRELPARAEVKPPPAPKSPSWADIPEIDDGAARKKGSAAVDPGASAERKVAKDAPAEVKDGYLSVNSMPPAFVFVDGKYTGKKTPLIKHPLSPGNHKLTLKPSGGAGKDIQITVTPGETTMISETNL